LSFKLRIYIGGLTTLVPQPINKRLVTLCPNVSSEERIRNVLGSQKLKIHKPVILFRVVDRFSDMPNFPLFKDAYGYLNGAWVLDREDVRITAGIGGKNGFEYTDEISRADITNRRPTFPEENNQDDIYWFTAIRGRNGQLKKARRELTADRCHDPNRDLSARLILDQGRLSTAGFSFSKETGEYYVFRGHSYAQSSASLAKIDLEVSGDMVVLQKQPFAFEYPQKKNGNTDILELRPGQDELVEICFLNSEYDEIIEQRPTIDNPDHFVRRGRYELPFTARLAEEPWDIDQPETHGPSRSGKYERRDADCANHLPWKLWLTPSPGHETPPSSGSCHPSTMAY